MVEMDPADRDVVRRLQHLAATPASPPLLTDVRRRAGRYARRRRLLQAGAVALSAVVLGVGAVSASSLLHEEAPSTHGVATEGPTTPGPGFDPDGGAAPGEEQDPSPTSGVTEERLRDEFDDMVRCYEDAGLPLERHVLDVDGLLVTHDLEYGQAAGAALSEEVQAIEARCRDPFVRTAMAYGDGGDADPERVFRQARDTCLVRELGMSVEELLTADVPPEVLATCGQEGNDALAAHDTGSQP